MALIASAGLPGSGDAARCISCEAEGEGEVEAQFLTIEIAGHGSVGSGAKTYCDNPAEPAKTCQVELAEGKTVELTATPGFEFFLSGWSGACDGTESCEVTMTEARTVKATFKNTPPLGAEITSPAEGQVFERTAEEPVEVSFVIPDDPTITFVTCTVDLSLRYYCPSSPWTTPKLGPGTHTVRVRTHDGGGSAALRTRTFTIVYPPAASGSTATDATGSAAAAAAPAPQPSPPPAKVAAKLLAKWALVDDATVFRRFGLKNLPAAAEALVTCRGKGCPFKLQQATAPKGAIDLTKLFDGRKLAPHSLIRVRLAAPGMVGETIEVRTRAGKAPRVTRR